MHTEHRDQASFCPFALREVSVLAELALGHLRYSLTDVPPQSNSPPDSVLESDHAGAFNGDQTARLAARRPHDTPKCAARDIARAAPTSHHSTRLAQEHRDSRRVSERRTRSASSSK